LKRETHQNIIKYMQNNMVLDYTNSWSLEEEYLIFLRHLMRFERVYSEDLLSSHSR